jgi:hypothetical protein
MAAVGASPSRSRTVGATSSRLAGVVTSAGANNPGAAITSGTRSTS